MGILTSVESSKTALEGFAQRGNMNSSCQLNEAMHRMSGSHVFSNFGRRGVPLIGDFVRWTSPER
jgi:hypothetical protein